MFDMFGHVFMPCFRTSQRSRSKQSYRQL